MNKKDRKVIQVNGTENSRFRYNFLKIKMVSGMFKVYTSEPSRRYCNHLAQKEAHSFILNYTKDS